VAEAEKNRGKKKSHPPGKVAAIHWQRLMSIFSKDTIIGTPEWNTWLEEIRRTRRLHVKQFAPPQVILDEKEKLKGLIVLRDELEATEEVGHKARKGQILFWYGDYSPQDVPIKNGIWNGYDVARNVYLVGPVVGELITQAELIADMEGTLRRFEMAGSEEVMRAL
jgi:hypothetical protein